MKKLFVVLFLFTAGLSFAQTGPKKFALVIGNQNYTSFGSLSRTRNDANDMETALKSMGFAVDKVLDGNLNQMQAALTRLKNNLKTSKDAYGFFYYSGHGAQDSNSENYLIPADADIPSESYVRQRALPLGAVMDEMKAAGNGLNIVVLDACRNLPASWSKSADKGLVPVSRQPVDTIVVYATRPGSVAVESVDGEKDSRNSVFTRYLLNHIATPDLDVNDMFRRAGADVIKASGEKQRPVVYSEFFGRVSLNQKGSGSVDPPPARYGSVTVTSEIAGDILIDGRSVGKKIKAKGTETVNNVSTGITEVSVKGDDGKTVKAQEKVMVYEGRSASAVIKAPAPARATTISATRSSLSFSSSGGNESVVVVTDGQSWYIDSSPSWCSTSKSGNTLSISCSSNSGSSSRSGTIRLKSDDKSLSISVSQDAGIVEEICWNCGGNKGSICPICGGTGNMWTPYGLMKCNGWYDAPGGGYRRSFCNNGWIECPVCDGKGKLRKR